MQRLLVLALLAGGVLRAETVLALPFFNHTHAADLDWIGESIAETVGDSLASGGVLILDRDDRLEGYRRLSLRPGAELTHASIIKIGEALDASKVVYGYYQLQPAPAGKDRLKSSLSLTVRIIDLKHMRQGPEFSETGALEDLAALEVHLSWQVLNSLMPKTAPSEQQFLRDRPPVRIDAVESYVRGLLTQSAEQRHHFFTQAARLDPNYSQPCFQLGEIYWEKKDYKIAANWFDRVKRSDSRYFEAQFFLGLSRYHMGDFDGAVQSFQTVVAEVPLNEVYNDLGAAQSRRNDTAAALANFRKAIEGDDADPDYYFNLACTQWRADQFDAAAASFRKVLERSPNDTEAASMLELAVKREGPNPGNPPTDSRQRLKTNYEETAYRQLQAELQSKK
ncbi:MAG TPA: tetratricopeptide repeat protein [Bryobacteraceae bacterium]|nr:tetratricopeptide repeat protein [Bryobacteraceae bacterium]